jgi:competence protein ComEC
VDTIKPYFLENYTSREGLLGVNFQPLEKFYSIGDKNLLLVDTLGIYKLKKTQVDWVLLTNSPKIHLEDLIEVLRPELILADGSNYTSFIERWRKTCLKYKIKFHDTASKGAFVIQAKP